MNDSVQKIKDRLSIIDVISPYVELHKAGKSYKGKSPFTNEKTPSFYVSPDRGMYYCFSSNKGGDMFTFIETMEGVDFKGALKILAEKAGVELVPEDPKKRDERETQYALIEDATQFFFKEREKNVSATEYVEKRGVEGKTMHVWSIGFAPDAWRSLKEYLLGKGYTETEMLRAGLIKKTDEAKESYDVFRNRIMFPIRDASGRVVAFSGRTLRSDPETPKYVNSPETELYQKSEILFGYDKAKQGIRQYDFSLIVEGQFDLVLSHQAGYGNAVAVSGTALTERHVELLQRLSNRAVLSLDSDRAGVAAVKRSAGIMLRRGMDVKVARIEGGKDPADIIKEDPKLFKKMVGNAVHVIEFLLEVLKSGAKDDRAYKLLVREEVIPLLAVMPNKIDREHFEHKTAEALQTTNEAIHYEVERVLELATKRTPVEPAVPSSKEPEITRFMDKKDDFVLYFNTILAVTESEESLKVLHTNVDRIYKRVIETYSAPYVSIEAPSASGINDYIALISRKIGRNYEEILRDMSLKNLASELEDKMNQFVKFLISENIKAYIELRNACEVDSDAYLAHTATISDLQRKREAKSFGMEDFLYVGP